MSRMSSIQEEFVFRDQGLYCLIRCDQTSGPVRTWMDSMDHLDYLITKYEDKNIEDNYIEIVRIEKRLLFFRNMMSRNKSHRRNNIKKKMLLKRISELEDYRAMLSY